MQLNISWTKSPLMVAVQKVPAIFQRKRPALIPYLSILLPPGSRPHCIYSQQFCFFSMVSLRSPLLRHKRIAVSLLTAESFGQKGQELPVENLRLLQVAWMRRLVDDNQPGASNFPGQQFTIG